MSLDTSPLSFTPSYCGGRIKSCKDMRPHSHPHTPILHLQGAFTKSIKLRQILVAYWGCLPSPPAALAVGMVFPLHVLSLCHLFLSAVPTADGTVSLRGVLS